MSGGDFSNSSYNFSMYLNNEISTLFLKRCFVYDAIYPIFSGNASVDKVTVSYVRSHKNIFKGFMITISYIYKKML